MFIVSYYRPIDNARGELEQQHINIEFRRAADDPPLHGRAFQVELDELAKLLRLAGVACSLREGVEYPIQEFLVTLSPEIASTFAMVLVTWVQQRTGRSVRVTMFDDDVDLQTAKDFESFVEKIKRGQDNKTAKGEAASS